MFILDWLQRCVVTAGIVGSANLRNALSLTLFSQFMSTKLENLIGIIDKARKIPSQQILTRTCGLDCKLLID